MSGTFVPMYGLNNMFGQIPIVGLIIGGGSDEGLIGVTYALVGTPGQPQLRVNPISAICPLRILSSLEFNLPPDPIEFPHARNASLCLRPSQRPNSTAPNSDAMAIPLRCYLPPS